jgi:hypothetical protein
MALTRRLTGGGRRRKKLVKDKDLICVAAKDAILNNHEIRYEVCLFRHHVELAKDEAIKLHKLLSTALESGEIMEQNREILELV